MPSDLRGVVFLLLNLLSFAIIGRALLSWFDPGMRTPVGRVLRDVTEPIIGPIRQVMPRMGMLDLSPFIALLLIQVLTRILNNALR